jgi:hypothetical protein
VTKHETKPVPDMTVRQVALALYQDDGKTPIKRVQRLIANGHLPAQKLPGGTGAYLVKAVDLRAYQQKQQHKLDKKRRQSED